MPHASSVLGRLRPARRSPVPPVAAVGSGHLVKAAAVLLRSSSAGGDQHRTPAAWAPAGAVPVALEAARPGPSTWFG